MKKNFKSILTILLGAAVLLPMASCADKATDKKADKPAAAKTAAGALPNYRYIDSDSVLAKYNLAKDYQEQQIRMENELQTEMNRHEGQLRNLQNSMQQKMQNGTYTEAAYKADQEKGQRMANTADQAVRAKQQALFEAQEKAQKALNDSIQNFLEDYNASHGYDAIFFKGAAGYFNPALDITDEIVEGLNARYNKVKK